MQTLKTSINLRKQDTANCLQQFNNTELLGKLELWCYQFTSGLLPSLVWSLTMYEVLVSHANCLERLVNSHMRKWLGLPMCLSSVRLYSDRSLSMAISGLDEEFKCARLRLDISLTESLDLERSLRNAARTQATRRKLIPATTT